MNSKKLIIFLIVIVVGYTGIIVVPNYLEQKDYNDCVKDSISEQQLDLYDYFGTVSYNTSPRTCRDLSTQEVFTESQDSILLP